MTDPDNRPAWERLRPVWTPAPDPIAPADDDHPDDEDTD